MKQLLIVIFSLLVFTYPLSTLAQNKTKTKSETAAKDTKQKTKMAAEPTNYPYTAEYSYKFEIGNPAYSKKILELWKDWDNNQLELHQDYFSDTITFQAPTGEVIKGKDKFLANGRQYRDMYTNVKSSLEVWIPLRSIDKNQDWVAVWGREEDTDKDGKVTTNMIQEVWGFNKDGKIVFYRQYLAKPPMQ
jgi:hypothetical protein